MDTISIHKARPLQNNIDLSESRLQHVAGEYANMQSMLAEWDGGVQAYPETEALWFYLQQHAMGLAERALDNDEPMGEFTPFITAYHTDIPRKTLRMFYYLLLICTRETRHANGGPQKTALYNKYPNIQYFHREDISDSSGASYVTAMLAAMPDVSLGEYTQFLVDAFGCSYSSGYGGKAWAAVATPLNEFVKGNISAEILMDTAFTLEHNNGQIFNKGMLYHNGNDLATRKILDVQRSGQIPQLIAENKYDLGSFISGDMQNYVSAFSKLDSGFTGGVNWSIVKDIHGHATWTQYIQVNEGMDWKAKLQKIKDDAAALIQQAKLKEVAAKAKEAAEALLKGSFEILPGVIIPKGKRSL